MLELRPNCEYCNKDLPPHSTQARICTFECTFCANCVETVLNNVCPNCGGDFTSRPIRPKQEHRPGVCLEYLPASSCRTHTLFTPLEIKQFVDSVASIPPSER